MKLIKLFKDGCDPCTQMSNFLKEQEVTIQEEYNIMNNIDVAVKYGAMSVPILILEDGEGKEIGRSIGFKPHEIMKLVSQL